MGRWCKPTLVFIFRPFVELNKNIHTSLWTKLSVGIPRKKKIRGLFFSISILQERTQKKTEQASHSVRGIWGSTAKIRVTWKSLKLLLPVSIILQETVSNRISVELACHSWPFCPTGADNHYLFLQSRLHSNLCTVFHLFITATQSVQLLEMLWRNFINVTTFMNSQTSH